MSQNAPALAPAPAPASPDSAPAAPSQTPKTTAAPAPSTERVLACVMCQQRKVKCNRKFPCNNCIRLGVSCVPATLNPRRRRRRFPERELLDRVRRYEALLRQNHVRFDSLFEETVGGPDPEKEDDSHDASHDTHDAASSLAALRQSGGSSRRRAVHDDEMMVDSDGDEAGPSGAGSRLAVKTGSSDAGHSPVPPASSSTTAQTPEHAPDTPSERRAEAINFWKAIRKGFYVPANAGDGKIITPESNAAPSENNNNNNDTSTAHDDGNSSDSDASDEVRHSSAALREMWARQMGSSGSLFFRGPHRTLGNVTALHPDPVQIFRLWQIYLQNVDPLLKITHTPTLQGRIVEAASNLEGIDPTLEALLFAIYCVAVHSMAPSDCQATFGSSKDDLLITYQPACEQALLNAGFLRTSERDCLAAFFLYLISLGHSIDHRSLYSMLGVGMRVAQAMQINNELGPGSGIKLSPLEAEMRRRLWWAMALFDARISELTNHSPTMLDPTWDCRLLLNANDFDFRPELKEPPVSASAAGGRGAVSSEALFAVVRSELGNAMRHMEYYLALSNPALKHMAKDREYVAQAQAGVTTTHPPRMPEFAEINALEDMIHDKYLQYCDPANGLHFMTIWTAKGFIAKCRLIKFFSRYANGKASSSTNANTPSSSTPTDNPSTPSAQHSSSSSVSPSEAMRDSALADALTVIESDSKIMMSPLTRRYRWLLHLYFPLPAYIFVTQELASRISGARATHAWAAMNDNYEARFALTDSEDRYMLKMFASTILLAWNACEARSRAAGEPQPSQPPEMILRVQKHLEEAKQASENQAEATAPNMLLDPGNGGAGVGGPEVSGVMGGGFATSLSMDLGQPGGGLTGSLFGGGPPGSGPPSVNASAFGGATPPAPPLFPSPNLGGGLGFGMGNMGNWPPMPMPWNWGPRPSWGG